MGEINPTLCERKTKEKGEGFVKFDKINKKISKKNKKIRTLIF